MPCRLSDLLPAGRLGRGRAGSGVYDDTPDAPVPHKKQTAPEGAVRLMTKLQTITVIPVKRSANRDRRATKLKMLLALF
ncbi:hypothetical protein GCM10009077_09170 [Roseibium denhamense]